MTEEASSDDASLSSRPHNRTCQRLNPRGMPVADLNAWTILRPRSIVMTKAALESFRSAARATTKGGEAKKRPARKPAAKRPSKAAVARAPRARKKEAT